MGSAGTLLLPDSAGTTATPHLAVQLSKAGIMYLLNRDNLGGYNTSADKAIQELTFGTYPYGIWGIPAYFNGNIYFWSANSTMQQYSLANGLLSTSPVAVGTYTEPGSSGYYQGTFMGGTPSISASSASSNGIVWVNDSVRDQGNPFQYLFAYDARNVATVLWNSNQNSARDFAGGSQKFAVPTIADGKVFLASDSQLQVYGLLPATYPQYSLSAFQPVLAVVPGSSVSTQIAVTPIGSFSGAVSFSTSGLPSGVTANFSSLGSGATLTLSASSSAALTTAPVTVTITGVSGAMSQSIPLSLSVASAPGPVAVNMASTYNVYGTFLNHIVPTNGGFDSEGYSYSANLLGNTISALGVPFYFAAPNIPNAVSSATIPLPAGSFSTLNLAGAAMNGNQPSQTFVVTYSDGTTTTFTQSLSDWGSPQNYSGETIASTMNYRTTPTYTGFGPFHLYAYSFAINPKKTLTSLTLPSNRNVAILALTLSGQTASTTPLAQTITFNPIPSQIVGGTLTVSATASSGLAVSFSIVQNGNCSISGNVVTFLNTGNCGVIANQAGNSQYAAAAAVGQIIVVNTPTAQTITFNTPASQAAGTTEALNATASSGLSVSFASSTASVCTVSGVSASLQAAGTCTIVASQPGNNVYGAATPVARSFTVTKVSTTVTVAPATLAAGNYNAFSASLAGFSSAPTTLGLGGVPCVNIPGCTVNLGGSSGLLNFEFAFVTSTSASLDVYVSTSIKPGTYAIPITLGTATIGTFNLTVPGSPGFTISTNSSFTLSRGTGGTLPVTITPANGFSGSVSLSLSGLLSGASDTFLTNSATSSTLVIYVSSTATAGTYTLTINGSSGSTAASTTFKFVVQ